MFKSCVPVLFYHHINSTGKDAAIKPEVFDWQMKYLRDKGFRTVFLDELAAYMEGKSFSFDSQKVVAVTFDDGYLDNWTYAFPILKKYDIKATLFVITSKIRNSDSGSESGDFLSWDRIREMQSSGLVDVQSHTQTHLKCDSSEHEKIKKELRDSKEIIEEKLNKACSFICWPWGKYTAQALSSAKECGYTGTVTSRRGINTLGSDIMRIKRFNVRPRIEPYKLWFAGRLFIYSREGWGRLYSFIVNKITGSLLKLLGVFKNI